MAVTTTGSSYISRTTTPTGDWTLCGWCLIPTAHATDYQVFLRFGSAASGQDGGEFATGPDVTPTNFYAAAFDDSGEEIVDCSSTHVNAWVFGAIKWTDATNTITLYTRLEGATSLTTRVTRATYDEAVTLWRVFAGRTGTANPKTGSMFTAIKGWSNDLTESEILAESAQKAPVVTTDIYTYISCDNGSTIGDDESGTGNDWTVTGGGLSTNATEPNMALPGAVVRRRLLLGVGF